MVVVRMMAIATIARAGVVAAERTTTIAVPSRRRHTVRGRAGQLRRLGDTERQYPGKWDHLFRLHVKIRKSLFFSLSLALVFVCSLVLFVCLKIIYFPPGRHTNRRNNAPPPYSDQQPGKAGRNHAIWQ